MSSEATRYAVRCMLREDWRSQAESDVRAANPGVHFKAEEMRKASEDLIIARFEEAESEYIRENHC